ncbi:MAG: ABC transporter permease [Ruminococcus flavefaciens]|nr:ABC transporter permease [Ruminococcus flavefaciens]MCM1363055.1 ABC transporter permease [Clostridiales bacterium]MCM1436023.1 ABC transporter permease [Ruminococcus flavefaciens]
MSKLLRSNFARLWKSRIFWLGMLFSAGLSIFFILMRYIDIEQHQEVYANLDESYKNADELIFMGGIIIIFAAAVFIGIFVGTEYSDGTLRNKLIIGHSRSSIYISNLIVCTTAGIIMHLTYIITTILLGNLLLEDSTLTFKKILLLTLMGTAAMIAASSLLVMISMLIHSKSAGAVAILIATMVMFFASMTIFQRLSTPEYNDAYSYIDEDTGKPVVVEKEKNTNYLTGTKRKVYEFLNDFIPTSQLYKSALLDSSKLDITLIYDGIIILITTTAGIAVFRRKNLK